MAFGSSSSLYEAKYNDIYKGTDVRPTSHHWDIHFVSAPKIFTDGDLRNEFLNQNFRLKFISWSGLDIPEVSVQPVNIRGHYFSQPTMNDRPNTQVQIQFDDTIDLNVSRYLLQVEYAMDDPETHSTLGRSPSNFSYDFYVDKLDPMGNVIARWMCSHCLLMNVQSALGSGDSSEVLQNINSMAFSVDYFKMYMPNSDGTMDPKSYTSILES